MQYDVILIDAGTGNLSSVYNALQFLGYRVLLTDRPDDLNGRTRVVLPGVGAFAQFIKGLQTRQLIEPIKALVQRQVPMLGICVGMQALFEFGEEMGQWPGLGLVKGRVPFFPDLGGLKIPHTGWNQVWHPGTCPLLRQIPDGSYFYFNHSFYCLPSQSTVIQAQTDYGIQYASVIRTGNVYGVQFHPEKSQNNGLQLLRNFMEL
ncbi:MAG: imidazole glycerol phosphate synthase subunit HisH [Anaerolineae bacterium]|nr:imidazole glycerol phosphate synthase subunit HisH [Anaerolineae bacterium]